MTYNQWSEKLYYHFFNEDNINSEVVLYTDAELLNALLEREECGVADFLKIFNPKNILADCSPQPKNNLSNRDRATLKDEFRSIEHLLGYLVATPNANFKINGNKINCSNPISYFPFIILIIYAYGTEDGILNEPQQQQMLGNENNIRKYTFDLLIKLAKHVNIDYNLNIHNIYGIDKGPNRYTGVFKYHSLFNNSQILALEEVIREYNINQPIYVDAEIIFRFGFIGRINAQTIAPAKLFINKIIDGSIFSKKKEQLTGKINNESKILLYPQIELANDIICKYSFRPNYKTDFISPESIFLKIQNSEVEIKRHMDSWYKSIIVKNFEENIISDTITIKDFLGSKGMFFQQLGQVFDTFSKNTNFFIFTDRPLAGRKTVFIGNQVLTQKLKKITADSSWAESVNCVVCDDLKTNLFFNGIDFETIPLFDDEFILDFFGGYKLNKSGHKKIYPYFLLPKLNFNLPKEKGLRISYQIEHYNVDVVDINENSQFVYQNTNPLYGKYALELNKFYNSKLEINKKLISIKAELYNLNDPDEVFISRELKIKDEFLQHQIKSKPNDIKPRQARIEGNVTKSIIGTESIKEIESDYLTRIIGTATIENNDPLNNKTLETIVSNVRYFKKLFTEGEESLDIENDIIKNLRALGYLKVKQHKSALSEDYIYEPADLALVERSDAYQGYSCSFFLSGLRSFEFMRSLIEAIKLMIDKNELLIEIKPQKNELSKILPNEIYFHFKTSQSLNDFLNKEIYYSFMEITVKNYIQIVPYNSTSLTNLFKIDVSNLEQYLTDIPLSDLVQDVNNDVAILIDGKGDEFSLVKVKNTNSVFIGKGKDYGNFREVNTNFGYVISFANNKIPYIFSKHSGGLAQGVGYSSIYINENVKMPQDVYNKLVYINGGLPCKRIIEIDKETTQFHLTPNSFDNIECAFPKKKTMFYKYEINIQQRKQLEDILGTKIIYLQNSTL